MNDDGVFVPGKIGTKDIRLGTPAKGLAVGLWAATPRHGLPRRRDRDAAELHFPVHISVHTTNIGGPSAGLAMTLGIINKLTDGQLTGAASDRGHRHHRPRRQRRRRGRGGREDHRRRGGRGHRLLRAAPGVQGRPVQGHPLAACLFGVDTWARCCAILRAAGGQRARAQSRPVQAAP